MMLISELARQTGLSIDTIRFYEKQGLLDETHFRRAANGYREYNEVGLQRLNLIKLGQAAGFTLSEMRHTIHAWETDQLSAEQKEHYMYAKLDEIEQKISALNEVKAYLREKIAHMRVQSELLEEPQNV
jgi:MerR family transcriptional regulator, copper efflux regulator